MRAQHIACGIIIIRELYSNTNYILWFRNVWPLFLLLSLIQHRFDNVHCIRSAQHRNQIVGAPRRRRRLNRIAMSSKYAELPASRQCCGLEEGPELCDARVFVDDKRK